MENFKIFNGLVYCHSKIVAIFALEPLDLVILPEQDQNIFEADMQRMLNSLQENSIQLVMRTRKATPADLTRHFSSMRKLQPEPNSFSGQEIKSKLLDEYVIQLSELLVKNIIPVKEYFVVFSQPAKVQNTEEVNKSCQLLERQIERIAANFKRAGISISQTNDKQLKALFYEFTRC